MGDKGKIVVEPLKVGVIGTSWWAENVLMPIFDGYERARLIAVCGRNRERGEALAAKYHVPQVFTDFHQMIEQGKLDAVVVVTPDDSHYEMVMAALDAGLHVFCEKPVALNAQHAKAMYDKAEAMGVKHMVFYTWHWPPAMQHFKQLVDEGSIGKIYHGNFQWQTSFWRNRDYSWRVDAERANGIIADLGSHMIHLALWTMGEIAGVSARLGFHIQRDGREGQPLNMANDSALVTLDFVSGAQAQIGLSSVARLIDPMQPTCILYGEKGTLEAGWIFGDDLLTDISYLRGGLDGTEEPISEEVPFHVVEYFKNHPVGPRLFVDSILDDKLIYPGLYEGYKVQQVIDAALESHRTGCRIVIAK
jgi:predicted dehydrogenase